MLDRGWREVEKGSRGLERGWRVIGSDGESIDMGGGWVEKEVENGTYKIWRQSKEGGVLEVKRRWGL